MKTRFLHMIGFQMILTSDFSWLFDTFMWDWPRTFSAAVNYMQLLTHMVCHCRRSNVFNDQLSPTPKRCSPVMPLPRQKSRLRWSLSAWDLWCQQSQTQTPVWWHCPPNHPGNPKMLNTEPLLGYGWIWIDLDNIQEWVSAYDQFPEVVRLAIIFYGHCTLQGLKS